MAAPESTNDITVQVHSNSITDNVIICEIDRQMTPGAIIYSNKSVSSLLGYSHAELKSISFQDICSITRIGAGADAGDTFHFQASLKKIDGSSILCNFIATTNTNPDSSQMHMIFKPVDERSGVGTVTQEVIRENNFRILEECSREVAHGINNAVNLIILSTDLLGEITTELNSLVHKKDPSVNIQGMNAEDLPKTINDLIENITSRTLKVSTVVQSLVQLARTDPPSETYDVRKILQTVVTLTEGAIKKSSSTLLFDSHQGILKRTGNPFQIQQALLNCILFICNKSIGSAEQFNIITTLIPPKSEFCIIIAHNGCTPLPNDFREAFCNTSSPARLEFSNHPLIIAQSLIIANGGSITLHSENPSGIEFHITFSMQCNMY